jgi:plasmid replication initiation protein
VEVRGAQNQEVYLTFSPRFEHIWLESKRRLLEYVAQQPGNIGLRSRYALRLYSWAKRYVTVSTKRISLEQLRTVLGLDSVKDADGEVIKEAPLAVWANLRQRALDTAIKEINAKTDLNIAIESIERAAYRRVTALAFAIKARTESLPAKAQNHDGQPYLLQVRRRAFFLQTFGLELCVSPGAPCNE